MLLGVAEDVRDGGEGTSAGSVTFAAYSPHVYQDMLWFDCWAGGPQQLRIGKYREKDVFRLTLHTLRSQNVSTADDRSLRVSVPAAGMIPATLVLKNTANLKSRFIFENGHVEFHPDGSGGLQRRLPHNLLCLVVHRPCHLRRGG